jgi:protein ImuB
MTRRPVWLLAAARPLPIRNDTPYFDGPLRYGAGERIESGWWDDNPVLRDYFVARNPRGACLWIYREIVQPRRWFLHGFFA